MTGRRKLKRWDSGSTPGCIFARFIFLKEAGYVDIHQGGKVLLNALIRIHLHYQSCTNLILNLDSPVSVK